MPNNRINFSTQFKICRDARLNDKYEFQSFKDFPQFLPAHPHRPKLKKMMAAIASGELTGLNAPLCGKFGGYCDGGNTNCKKLRNVI